MNINEKPVFFHESRGRGKNVVIFIHGYGLNRKSWYDIVDTISENAMVYMVDLIGSGDSSAPENWSYTIESQAEVIFDFIEENGFSNITLVGHSYGGGVSLMLLDQMMEKGCDNLVKRLVLIAPAAYPQPLPFFIAIPCIPFVGAWIMKCISAEFQMKLTLKRVVYNDQIVTSERINRYKKNIARPTYRKALIQTAKNVIPRETGNIFERIEKIKSKVLLIYGENESVILKDNLEKLSHIIPDIETKVIADCGHIPHEEHPGRVSGMITRFLLIT